MVVRWWLLQELPQRLEARKMSAPAQVALVTGHGESRVLRHGSVVKQRVVEVASELGTVVEQSNRVRVVLAWPLTGVATHLAAPRPSARISWSVETSVLKHRTYSVNVSSSVRLFILRLWYLNHFHFVLARQGAPLADNASLLPVATGQRRCFCSFFSFFSFFSFS